MQIVVYKLVGLLKNMTITPSFKCLLIHIHFDESDYPNQNNYVWNFSFLFDLNYFYIVEIYLSNTRLSCF